MLKIIFIILGVILVLALAAYFLIPKGAKYSDYAFLTEPRITQIPGEKVIEVISTGDPLVTVQPAFSILFKTYYKLNGVNKMKMPAPRARWLADLRSPKETWEGHFAIPVPGIVSALPVMDDTPGLKVELTNWEYGEVAEILHVGPYDKEEPTTQKLSNFINDSGYEIIGPHEEEYLKGPMPFLPSNPEKFLTIIRYRVKKKEL